MQAINWRGWGAGPDNDLAMQSYNNLERHTMTLRERHIMTSKDKAGNKLDVQTDNDFER